MPLTLLTSDEQREYVLRTGRALEPEEKRHLKKKGELAQDAIDRGLLHSSVHVGNLVGEGLEHLRAVGEILRSELFTILEGKRLRLAAKQESLISLTLRDLLRPRVDTLNTEIDAAVRDWGGHLGLTPAPASEKFDAQMRRESDENVGIRIAELRRKQSGQRRTWVSERVEKLLWLVVGAILGACCTLFAQWVRGR